MLGNAPFPAAEAMVIGLIDGVVEDDLIGAALALARDIAADGARHLPTGNRREGFRDPIAYQTAIAAARIPEAEATARPLAKIGVLGAGRMGAG